MKEKISVNIISETEFSVKGHGVHTAYVEMRDALAKHPEIELFINDKKAKTDIIHIHTMGPYSLRFLRKKHGKKVISGHLVPDSFVGSLKGATTFKSLVKKYMRTFYNQADLILGVSDYTKNELLKLGVKKPIELLYNSIDTAKYLSSPAKKQAARKKLNIATDKFVVIGAGQVQPRKRVDIYSEMAQALPEVEFIWVGGIPFGAIAADNTSMAKLMKNHPENLRFTNTIPLEEVVDYYHAADAFVFPSLQETFGLVIVEAAASGLPIVLRDIDDYKTTFANSALLAKNDTDFLKIVKKLQSNEALRAEYVKKAANIAQRFDVKTATDQLVNFYRQLLN